MCNACGFYCCGSDQFRGCGCDQCEEPDCWDDDDPDGPDAPDWCDCRAPLPSPTHLRCEAVSP